MPVHEIALPVGAKNLDPPLPTILRSSKDGDIPIVQIFAGDNFVGEVIEGHWKKHDDIVNVGRFIGKLASGSLELTAKTWNAGTYLGGWLNSHAGVPILQNGYIDIHMETHTATPSYDTHFYFYLRGSKAITEPVVDDNFLEIRLTRTTTPTYTIQIRKEINGTPTTIYTATVITNSEGTFRIKFRPTDSKMDIYFHDGSGAVAESTDELTLIDDALDLNFDVGYPSFHLDVGETTFRTVLSDGITVSYPNTGISYDRDVTDIGKGDIKIWDTMASVTESDWNRVHNEDHDFVGDCVIENGLIRLMIDDAAQYGIELYYWTGSTWSQPIDKIWTYLDTDTKDLAYAFLKGIESMESLERVTVKLRLCETGTEDDDFYTELYLTLKKGKYHFMTELGSVVPRQDVQLLMGDTTSLTWSFTGDDKVANADLNTDAVNTTLTDNYMIHFDDAGSAVIGFIASDQKPTGGDSSFTSSQGDSISFKSIALADYENVDLMLGLTPFADIANLLVESEDCIPQAPTSGESDGTASGGLRLDYTGQDGGMYKALTAGTDLPIGRYLLVIRAYDANQIADDLRMSVYNQSEIRYINEDDDDTFFTLTGSWAYYSIVFDIKEGDDGDTIRLYANKDTATTNTISTDFFLIIPLSDGESMVQDIAHNAMRSLDIGFRLTDKALFEIFSGAGLGYGALLTGTTYTDAMAIAAVEGEPTLDLSGILTAATIKTKADNAGIYLGESDDFRMYHDGADTYFRNTVGTFYIQSQNEDMQLEASNFFLEVDALVQIKDTDDGDAILFELDTTGRTIKIGSDADVIIQPGAADYDKFLVLDNGQLKFRTGSQIASDIGAATVPLALTDLAAGTRGSLISRGVSDWGELHVGGSSEVLKTDGLDVGWGFVDYSDLIGSQPAPIAHILATSGPHTGTLPWSELDKTSSSLADLATRTHASLSDAPADAHHVTFVLADFTTAFAAESLANLATRTHGNLSDAPTDAHHTEAHVLAVTGPHSGELPLTDLAAYGQGSIIIGGGSDWENLVAGTENYVLKMGVAEPAWSQVDYSELSGTQPAPIAHNLIDTTGHPVTGLTPGHVLTALTATTYGFATAGGGGVTAQTPYTTGKITKWDTGGVDITDSIISDNGSTATVAGALGLSTGTTINEFSIDDLLAGASDDAAPTEQAVKAYVDRHTSIGSANSQWITCPYEGASAAASDIVNTYNCVAPQANCYLTFTIPLAVSRGGKKLWIAGSRIGLRAANGTNYITSTVLRGFYSTGYIARDTDATDKNSVTLWTDNFTDQDMTLSGGLAAKIHLQVIVATGNQLQINFVQVEYYYA